MYNTKTVSQIVDLIANREISCYDLTQHFLTNIHASNTVLNCFITITDEQALQQAQLVDKYLAKNKTSNIDATFNEINLTLAGVPIAYKDNIYTKNITTTCASKLLKDFKPSFDATVVKNLTHAGCIMLGKNNMDELAMGVTNETSCFGAVRNPWNINYIPGGSSGGSACAVSAGLVPVSLGTDTGGSSRQPSALCGVTGLKPTHGVISNYGVIPVAKSLDQIGIICRNAQDIALILPICSHPYIENNINNKQLFLCKSLLTQPINGLKIGIPRECLSDLNETENSHKTKVYQEAIQVFKQLGCEIIYIDLPNLPHAMSIYSVLSITEFLQHINNDCDAEHFYLLHKCLDEYEFYKQKTDIYHRKIGTEVIKRLSKGLNLQKYDINNEQLYHSQSIQKQLKQDFVNAYKKVDLILTPTTPVDACLLGEKQSNNDHPINKSLADIYSCPANLTGLPAIAFPIGFVNNMPMSLQFIGNPCSESTLLQTVHNYQLVTNWHTLQGKHQQSAKI